MVQGQRDHFVNPERLTRRQARELDKAFTSPPGPRRQRDGRSASDRPKPARKKGTVSHKLFSFGGLFLVSIFFIGTSVPANAFVTIDATSAPVVVTTPSVPGQSVEVSANVVAETPMRDSFGAVTQVEQVKAARSSSSATPSYVPTTGTVRWPFPYSVSITDGFGPRAENVSGSSFHNGVDFTPGGGKPIYAIAAGTVITHDEDGGGFGNHVILQHNINGQSIQTVYAHMVSGSSSLSVGDVVNVGDFIGNVGNTGNSYGAHLHFEVRIDKVPVDPYAWLKENATN